MNHAALRCSSILLALAASGAMAGNVVHDGSLGPAKTLNGPNYTILPSDGRQVGGNLFHSFAKLNLSAGDVATFTGPTSVRNVLARVTDGAASDIDGTLRSSIPGANVFFMNPAGIVFGPNSALDIDGAFVATTADVIKLADGGKFSGDTDANNSVLSSADPSAFGFLKAQARPIVVSGNASTNSTARLITRPGKTLSIVGGDATVSSGELSAPSGRINLISVQSPGEVSGDLVSADASAADVSSFTSLGVAGINNFSSADVSGDSAGKLVVRAGTLSMDLFSLIAASAEDLDSPFSGIDLALRDSLDMSRGSIISASTSGTANGPPIRIIARVGRIVSDDSDFIKTSISTSTSGAGSGGDIELHFRRLDLLGSAQLSSGVLSAGAGGDIVIHGGRIRASGAGATILASPLGSGTGRGGDFVVRADSLELSAGARALINSFTVQPSGVVTLNITGELRLSGNGTALEGNGRLSTSAAEAMLIVAGRIVLDDRSVISSTTFQDQPSGLLFLSADSIRISGGASIRSSTFGGADGGTIAIETPLLSLSNAGSIFTLATGIGPAGQIVISADTIQMDSDASIDSNTSPSVGSFTSTGPGGDVLITTRVLDMRGGAVISSATVGGGPAGSVSVIATESVTLSGNGSGINSPTVPIGSGTIGGNGGLVNVITSSLRIENGASVRASTATTGTGGEISVGADQIEIVGHDDPDFPTGISSRSFGQFSGAGRGGDLVVVAGRLHLTNGGVVSSAATGVGDAGSVRITADDLSLDNGGQIATSADNANGGLTSIVATRDITLNSNARISAAAAGTGGNISLNAGRSVQLRNSTITAAAGNQGNIAINAPGSVIVLDSTITAQAEGTGGAISIDPPRFVVLNRSTINGLAGGTDVLVTINTNSLLTSRDSQILTDRGFFSIDTDLAESLSGFDLTVRNAGARLQESCDVRAFGDVSSFNVTGAGGITLDPAKAAPAANP